MSGVTRWRALSTIVPKAAARLARKYPSRTATRPTAATAAHSDHLGIRPSVGPLVMVVVTKQVFGSFGRG